MPRLRSFAFTLGCMCAALASASAVSAQVGVEAPLDAAGDADPFEGSSPAETRDREARTLFEAGRLAFADGRFEDALHYFERAYELSERPALLFNVAASLDRLQRSEDALRYFELYLEQIPDAENRREVQSRIDALEIAVTREREAEEARRERDALLAERAALRDEDPPGVLEQWWFWAVVGAVVAGGIVAAVLLSQSDSVGEPPMGNIPGITMTLRSP